MGTCPLIQKPCEGPHCQWWEANTKKCSVLLIAETLAAETIAQADE